MLEKRRLPIGISSFTDLRNTGRIYIDKTVLIGQMANDLSYVFLSRPRRFGKSLLVSTLASLFEHGLRDFKGLSIEKTWRDKTYPVVRLDFSKVRISDQFVTFQQSFDRSLCDAFAKIGFVCNHRKENDVLAALDNFLSNYEDSFVLLIDEYDSPLTRNLNNPELFKAIRLYMRDFFAILKACSGALRFLFITGITKYRQVSVFSELNNLTDISLDPQYGELLGYTREDIEKYFPDFIVNAVESLNSRKGTSYTHDSLVQELIANYDGFCFDRQASTHVFAPWSVLNFLSTPQNGFENYWIGSGGISTWLANWITQHGMIDAKRFDTPVEIDVDQLNVASTPSEIPPEVLLFQTGYLSITKSDLPTLTLAYPNKEVASAMGKLYFNQFVDNKPVPLSGILKVLRGKDIQAIVENLNLVFMKIPYDKYPVRDEYAVRGIVLSYVMGAGLPILTAEEHNALGRSDIETTVGDTHWVFEFKFVKKDADAPKALGDALDQIQKKHYGESSGDQDLIRIGMVFSDEQRQIVTWKEVE